MREPVQHDWTFFRSHQSGNGRTGDEYHYCRRCGVIRATYVYRRGDTNNIVSADPTYWGVGVSDGTIDQPLCIDPEGRT